MISGFMIDKENLTLDVIGITKAESMKSLPLLIPGPVNIVHPPLYWPMIHGG